MDRYDREKVLRVNGLKTFGWEAMDLFVQHLEGNFGAVEVAVQVHQ